MAGHCYCNLCYERYKTLGNPQKKEKESFYNTSFNFKLNVCCLEESNVNLRGTLCSLCVCRYLVGTQRMFLLDPIQYKTEYNVQNTKQNTMCKIQSRIQCAKYKAEYKRQNLTYSYLLSLCTRVDIYNKELNLNIWRSKLSDKSKFALNVSSENIYCLWISDCTNTTSSNLKVNAKTTCNLDGHWTRHHILQIYVVVILYLICALIRKACF